VPRCVTLQVARIGFLRRATAAARLRAVRRWLSILLLVLLPLQFTWALAADYEVHDGSEHSMHLWHHDHAHGHGDAQDAPEGDAGAGGPSIDADGHHCHGQCSAMPAPACLVPALLSRTSVDSRSDVHGGAYAPPRPERPQWARLA
jgi:hypothetical protein